LGRRTGPVEVGFVAAADVLKVCERCEVASNEKTVTGPMGILGENGLEDRAFVVLQAKQRDTAACKDREK
jgi:hypothetical protein